MTPGDSGPALTLDTFLAQAEQFRLGQLPTEQPHRKTLDLAEWANSDLRRAIAALTEVDADALDVLSACAPDLSELARSIGATLDEGGRVYLCGCGATGRLALSLEAFWREQHNGSPAADRVVAFMAGGDVALIRSVEGFEDHPGFGARHLEELGFGAGDLLVASTEGGETPYVLGAAWAAAERSRRRPWVLYCNPNEALRSIERSRQTLEDPRIRCLSIATGPMALSGSTRMQASTVLMLAIGLALLQPDDDPSERLRVLRAHLDGLEWAALAPLIEAESAIYDAGEYVLYESDRHDITVLTDTTERSPTFSLTPFENQREPTDAPSLCYLLMPSVGDAETAWSQMLLRAPRPLNWSGLTELVGRERLLGFDFSRGIAGHRARRLPDATHHRFFVDRVGEALQLALGETLVELPVAGLSLLEEHIVLKLALNIHSTLVMGRLGRYESNVMTWVRPSNMKLIDRAIRYVDQLWRRQGREALPYQTLATAVFAAMDGLQDNQSVVLETLRVLRTH